jgi:hypothetical protein
VAQTKTRLKPVLQTNFSSFLRVVADDMNDSSGVKGIIRLASLLPFRAACGAALCRRRFSAG